MKLVVANLNYSSWSVRPWLTLVANEIPFEEEKVSFNAPDFAERVRRVSPTGLVPCLVDGDRAIWDSLAIVEYLAERFPEKQLWPADATARAHARSACAEMHSGFRAMRNRLPMNVDARFSAPLLETEARRDVERVTALWVDARKRFGDGGPYLYGRFSIADAYYAPVTRRFVTYSIALPDAAHAYVEAVERHPAVVRWLDAAAAEREYVAIDEPYRDPPA